MKKYILTENTKTVNGHKLYQIKALRSFGTITAGDLGGFIEKESNLSHYGNAWVYVNARVFGDAWVSGNARVFGDAWVSGNAQVYGDARVYDDAKVYGDARVYGNAQVFGDAWVSGNAQVYGNALPKKLNLIHFKCIKAYPGASINDTSIDTKYEKFPEFWQPAYEQAIKFAGYELELGENNTAKFGCKLINKSQLQAIINVLDLHDTLKENFNLLTAMQSGDVNITKINDILNFIK